MEAVLPLRLSGGYCGHDLQRARILLRSLGKFWRGTSPLRLTVIGREADWHVLRSALQPGGIKMALVRETDLLPALADVGEDAGWYKQQLLKLAAHRVVSSPFYLVLDADLICAQPFSDESLIVDGKALTDWEARSVHAEWWRGSAEILKLPHEPGGFGFSVTPEVLSGDLCARLIKHLGSMYDTDWCTFLLGNRIWTEFTLYCLFASRHGPIDRFHHGKDWMTRHSAAIRSKHNVWHAASFDAWRPERAFEPGAKGVFMVCQSNTRIDPDLVWSRVGRFLE